MKICVQRYYKCALVSVLLTNASLQKKKEKIGFGLIAGHKKK